MLTTLVNIITSYILKAFLHVEANIASTIGIILSKFCLHILLIVNGFLILRQILLKKNGLSFSSLFLGRAFYYGSGNYRGISIK